MQRTDSHFTRDQLEALFTYKDGQLYWKKTKGRRVANTLAGTKSHHYWQVGIDYVIYRVHRLIWIYHHGASAGAIDHINGNTFDNRIENLRECDLSQNQYNRKISKNNSSGIKGISWNSQKNKWRARIIVDGKDCCIGHFDNLRDAETAIDLKRVELHGIFARNH